MDATSGSIMKIARRFANFLTPRRTNSFFCFVAALFLQAPVMAGLLIASGACCAGEHCPITAHHHGAAKTEEAPMDCGHNMDHNSASVRSCSMSCCNTAEQAAVHSNVFVLSLVIKLASINPLPETISGFDANEVATPSVPLSPPPKSLPSLI